MSTPTVTKSGSRTDSPSRDSASSRGDTARLFIQPFVVIIAVVGVLWWAFASPMTETQAASLNAASIIERKIGRAHV